MHSEIPIIYNFARSGGTLLNRCLGCIDKNIVFSEVNPHGEVVQLEDQAIHWFNLIDNKDYQYLKNESYTQKIKYLFNIIKERNQCLIIRDWTVINFVDLVGLPKYITYASGEMEQELYLNKAGLTTKPIAFVRRSASVYSSLLRTFPHLKQQLTINKFSNSYLNFCMKVCKYPIYRYEEFCQNPIVQLQNICEYLRIPYDSSFLHNFYNYEKCSGDNRIGSRGSSLKKISQLSNDNDLDTIYATALVNEECQKADKLLGYLN